MDSRILDVLIGIKETYGEAVFFNHQMVKNLLNDLAPGLHKERIQISLFLETNGFFQLKHAENTFPMVRRRLIMNYAETYSAEISVATWVVDLFSALLGFSDIKMGTHNAKTTTTPFTPVISVTPVNKANTPELLPLNIPVKTGSTYSLPDDMRLSHSLAKRISADVHSVMATKDGRVLAAGSNDDGQCNTWWWTDIKAVSAGSHFTIGLKKDGTVLATGRNDFGQCNIKHLMGIRQISAGMRHMAALREDGSVIAVGDNSSGECNVSKWRHMVHIVAGCRCTFGIKKDGRVLVSGHETEEDLQLSHLQNISDIAHARTGRALALLKKGTVARMGKDDIRHKNFSQWKGLRQISAAPDYFAGLFHNGTVRLLAYFWPDTGIECAPNDWCDIIAIAAGRYHLIGLRKDGHLEAAMLHPSETYDKGQCKVGEWRLQ